MNKSNLFLHIIPRKEAKRLGLKRYFTGKPCKHGHIAERKVCDWMCMECNRIKYKDWLSRNRAEKNAKDAKWYAENKDRAHAAAKRWKESNKDYVAHITKGWRKRNHSHIIAYNAEKRARVKRASVVWHDSKMVKTVYQKASDMQMEVDHIVPITSDFVCGLHSWDNLQLLDKELNQSKKNLHWPDMPDTKDPELLELVKEFKHEHNNL